VDFKEISDLCSVLLQYNPEFLLLSIPQHLSPWQCKKLSKTVAEFIAPDWGDKVNFGL
jgi:hypothetical protein